MHAEKHNDEKLAIKLMIVGVGVGCLSFPVGAPDQKMLFILPKGEVSPPPILMPVKENFKDLPSYYTCSRSEISGVGLICWEAGKASMIFSLILAVQSKKLFDPPRGGGLTSSYFNACGDDKIKWHWYY